MYTSGTHTIVSGPGDGIAPGAATETTAPLNLYVRRDGDDINPGTIAQPLATPQEAYRRIPKGISDGNYACVHLGDDGGTPWQLPTNIGHRQRDQICWICDGAGEVGFDKWDEIIASTAAIAGSSQFQIVTALAMATAPHSGYGEHFGRFIEVLSGAAAGDIRKIAWNDATTFYTEVRFSAPIAAGDTFRVVIPKTEVYLPDYYDYYHALSVDCGTPSKESPFWGQAGDPDYETNEMFGVMLVCMKFIPNQPSIYNRIIIRNSRVFLIACYSDYTTWVQGDGAVVSGFESYWQQALYGDAYNEGTPFLRRIGIATSSTQWVAGFTLANTQQDDSVLLVYDEVAFAGYFTACRVFAYGRSKLHMRGGSCWRAVEDDWSDGSQARIHIGYSERIKIGNPTFPYAIRIYSGTCFLSNYSTDVPFDVTADDHIISAVDDGRISLYATVPAAILLTAGNAGTLALHVKQKGHITLKKLPSFACNNRDFSVNDGQIIHPIADLLANADWYDPLYGMISRES